jgi:hypothetical protein
LLKARRIRAGTAGTNPAARPTSQGTPTTTSSLDGVLLEDRPPLPTDVVDQAFRLVDRQGPTSAADDWLDFLAWNQAALQGGQ